MRIFRSLISKDNFSRFFFIVHKFNRNGVYYLLLVMIILKWVNFRNRLTNSMKRRSILGKILYRRIIQILSENRLNICLNFCPLLRIQFYSFKQNFSFNDYFFSLTENEFNPNNA